MVSPVYRSFRICSVVLEKLVRPPRQEESLSLIFHAWFLVSKRRLVLSLSGLSLLISHVSTSFLWRTEFFPLRLPSISIISPWLCEIRALCLCIWNESRSSSSVYPSGIQMELKASKRVTIPKYRSKWQIGIKLQHMLAMIPRVYRLLLHNQSSRAIII